MTWLEAVPSLAVAGSVLLVPGLVTCALLGARGLVLWSAAGPVSLGVVALSAVAAHPLDVRWGPTPLVIGTLTIWSMAWVVGRRLGSGPPDVRAHRDRRSMLGVIAAWASAALVLGAQVIYMVGAPGNIAHLHDNMFHLNAVRHVAESGNGSSLYLGRLGVDSAAGYYPGAWHDVVALASSVTADVPAAVNVTNLALICTSWPLGCMLLARVVTNRDTLAAVVGAVLSTGFSGFPFLLYHFGVVYPWMAATALLPGFLGLIALALGRSHPPHEQRGTLWALVLASSPGIALTHPSVFVLSLGLAAPMVLPALWRPLSQRRASAALVAVITYLAALSLAWVFVRPPRASNWTGVGDPLGAFVRTVMVAPIGGPIPWVVVALILVGLVVLPRWPGRVWVLWTYCLGLFLVVATNLRQVPELRWWISGVWYSDPFRAASVSAVAFLPVACLGAYAAVSAARARWSPPSRVSSSWTLTGLAVVALVLSFALARTPAVAYSSEIARRAHEYTESSRLITVHELRLMRRLQSLVPADALIAGDPLTGAALSYAFAGRASVQPVAGLSRGADGALVMARLDQMTTDSSVCPAVRRLRVGFVLDFGEQAVDRGLTSRVPGLQDLTSANGFRLVASEGPAKLYEITGCRPTTPG